MKRIATMVLFLAGLAAPATAQEAAAGPHGMANGMFLELRFGGGISAVAGQAGGVGGGALSGGGLSAVPTIVAGIRLVNRLQLGLGFGFFRFAVDGPGMNTASYNVFYFSPAVTYDLVRAKDNRAAFYGKAGLTFGADIGGISGAPDSTGFVVGYDVGVGMRFALHPMVALGMEAGLLGTFVNPERNSNDAFVTTFYSTLVGTFYFGGK